MHSHKHPVEQHTLPKPQPCSRNSMLVRNLDHGQAGGPLLAGSWQCYCGGCTPLARTLRGWMAGPTSLVSRQEVSLAVDPEARLVEHARTQPGTQIGGWLGGFRSDSSGWGSKGNTSRSEFMPGKQARDRVKQQCETPVQHRCDKPATQVQGICLCGAHQGEVRLQGKYIICQGSPEVARGRQGWM